MHRALRTIIRATAPALIALLVVLVIPVQACGCGGYVPGEGDARIAEERALIRWDGKTQDIVMQLGVEGESKHAAWFLPVPARATVKLADPKLFDELQELTKPEVRVQRISEDIEEGSAVGGGAGGVPVAVVGQQSLGPFHVTTLRASEADALTKWLQTNGYEPPEGLSEVVEPYVEQDWYYLAVKLRPRQEGEALSGVLDPLWVTFPSKQIIYPMRVTALAELDYQEILPVYLYILAEHRVDNSPQFPTWRNAVKYANWVDPESLEKDSALRQLLPKRLFLTKFEILIDDPERVQVDWTFDYAEQDETYRDVQIEYEFLPMPTASTWIGLESDAESQLEVNEAGGWSGILVLLALMLVVAVLTLFGFIWRRYARRPMT